jgi:hypothetical protein
MAILIRRAPKGDPTVVQLGSQLRVNQALSSTRPSESAKIVYSMSATHNIRFATPCLGDQSGTTACRTEKVGGQSQEIDHVLVLVAKPGAPSVTQVTISEEVSGETGTPKHSAFTVMIRP